MYKRTGNPQTLSQKGPRAVNPGGVNYLDGSNNGQGLLSWCYLMDVASYSAAKTGMAGFHSPDDANNYNTLNLGPLPPSLNTSYTVYGTYNRHFYSGIAFATNWNLNDTVNQGNGGSLDQDVFYDNGFGSIVGMGFDTSNHYFGNSLQ
jgi:hypothetical protein